MYQTHRTAGTGNDVMTPVVGIIMGSRSDWDVMAVARDTLESLQVPHELRIVSAHRTPLWMAEYAQTAESRGLRVIIAGAGGAAHLPGMVAAHTSIPVLGVPVPSTVLNGIDAMLSIVQMPGGIPVGTLAIGKPGARNAAILAARILALTDADLAQRLRYLRAQAEEAVRSEVLE